MTFKIENVDWSRSKNRLKQLRKKVFVLEWRLPEETEFDDADPSASHILISTTKNKPVATARLTADGIIGRLAILPRYRKQALYQQLYVELLKQAQQRHVDKVQVHCELHTVEHHTALGFTPCGQVFMEAGIPRQPMECPTSRFKMPQHDAVH